MAIKSTSKISTCVIGIALSVALLGVVLVNAIGVGQQQARADLINDLNNIIIDKLDLQKNIAKLNVNFYVYSDNAKTGDLKTWIKIRDWSIYKTINYATAKKYTGVNNGEQYALASFSFAPLTRNIVIDSFAACVQTVSTGEQLCTTHYWSGEPIINVYSEAYPGY